MSALRMEAARDEPEASPVARGTQLSAAPGRLLFPLQIGLLLAMAITVATKVWQQHVWFGWLIVALTVLAWLPELRRDRDRRWWFAYVAGIFVYTLLRSYASKTGIPVRSAYAIDIDRHVFGIEPVIWLQTRLFHPTNLSLLDWLTVMVHWSFFIAPHAAAIAIFVWRRSLFPRYTVLVVGTMYAGLLLFYLVPTAPPWLAAQAGTLPGAFRVMDFVGGRVSLDTYQSFYASLGEPNSVAAMPSIHMAVTFAMFLWARDHYPRLAIPLLVYSLVMGFSLIYMAEHYFADLVAGIICAGAVHLASRKLMRVPSPAATTA